MIQQVKQKKAYRGISPEKLSLAIAVRDILQDYGEVLFQLSDEDRLIIDLVRREERKALRAARKKENKEN